MIKSNSISKTILSQPTRIKIVAVGASGVGKSSLSNRFINNEFNPCSSTTLGAIFMQKLYEYIPGNTYKIQIWDTTGQQKYKSIARIYYKDAKVALLVYDINDESSFISIEIWAQEVINSSAKDILLVVVGNKIDIGCSKNDYDGVDENQVRLYSKAIGAIFHLISAKDNIGLNQLFYEICMILSKRQIFEESNSIILNNNKSKTYSKKCCN